jgi:hypothetical protein
MLGGGVDDSWTPRDRISIPHRSLSSGVCRGCPRSSTVDGRRTSPATTWRLLVRLTESGLEFVDQVVGGHLDTERELLQSLWSHQQQTLARLLRTALLGLGDRPPERPTP